MRLPSVARHVWRPLDRAGPHYLFLMLSGASGLTWPPPSLRTAALITLPFYVTMGSLIVGGALCTYGRWKHSPTPKIYGLVFILISLATYVLALLTRWPESAVTVFFLLAFMSLLGRQLQKVKRTHDARLAVSRGEYTGSDLATYALDSLAGRRHSARGDRGGTESPGGSSAPTEWDDT